MRPIPLLEPPVTNTFFPATLKSVLDAMIRISVCERIGRIVTIGGGVRYSGLPGLVPPAPPNFVSLIIYTNSYIINTNVF